MSSGKSTCRGCGAEVIWIRTAAGFRMPVDAEPVWIREEHGGNTFVKKDGTIAFGRKIGDAYEAEEGDNLAEVFESHFATCPVGGQFRNRKPRTRPPGYR